MSEAWVHSWQNCQRTALPMLEPQYGYGIAPLRSCKSPTASLGLAPHSPPQEFLGWQQ